MKRMDENCHYDGGGVDSYYIDYNGVGLNHTTILWVLGWNEFFTHDGHAPVNQNNQNHILALQEQDRSMKRFFKLIRFEIILMFHWSVHMNKVKIIFKPIPSSGICSRFRNDKICKKL